jgi:hypothetical protein
MKIHCPNCKEYTLTYWEKMSLAPKKDIVLPSVICRNCQFKIGTTSTSRYGFILFFVFCMALGLFIVAKLNLNSIFAPIPFLISLAASYFLVWPYLVRVKPWCDFKYYLPKSRLVGYGIYLFIPIVLIVGLFVLGIKFGWGM